MKDREKPKPSSLSQPPQPPLGKALERVGDLCKFFGAGQRMSRHDLLRELYEVEDLLRAAALEDTKSTRKMCLECKGRNRDEDEEAPSV